MLMIVAANSKFKDVILQSKESGFADYFIYYVENHGIYMLVAAFFFALVTFLLIFKDSKVNAYLTSVIVLLAFIIIFPTFSAIDATTQDRESGVLTLTHNAEHNINQAYKIGNLENLHFIHETERFKEDGESFRRIVKTEVRINSIELAEEFKLVFVYRDNGEPTLLKINNVTDTVIEYLER